MSVVDVLSFIERWRDASASERANKDAFLLELCDALGVPRPTPATGDPERDLYVFEHDAVIVSDGGRQSIGHVDLYKHGCFILEAKQGSLPGSAKVGVGKRGSPTWNVAMHAAYGQALGYARTMDEPPPFILVADIGYCIDVYSCFDGSGRYEAFPNARKNRLFQADLEQHLDLLRDIFVDPLSRDPQRYSAKVTREIAGHLAELAKDLEEAGRSQVDVAKFLMRCLFTMFAEDVGLLPPRSFAECYREELDRASRDVPGRGRGALGGDERRREDDGVRQAPEVQRGPLR